MLPAAVGRRSEEAERAAWFERQRAAFRAHYLAEPGNPYRESGRSSGAERWEESRRPIAGAIERDGDFMDVGCANGLLLESLVGWAAERGHRIRPHGIDFVPELVELARRRHPGAPAEAFEVANAFDWRPRRRYDWVRTELEYVPPADRAALARRLVDEALAPGGRLVLCHYCARDERAREVAAELAALGLRVVGSASARGLGVAWAEGPR
jgi:2-polyprenyl-3-methyl-5-hydroxy-6-metoxy-1,4-benzoquinol methylase